MIDDVIIHNDSIGHLREYLIRYVNSNDIPASNHSISSALTKIISDDLKSFKELDDIEFFANYPETQVFYNQLFDSIFDIMSDAYFISKVRVVNITSNYILMNITV